MRGGGRVLRRGGAEKTAQYASLLRPTA